ncbi:MAG: tRNA pseudouridine(55) synthase TruB [Kiloniellales bacterium]
MRRRRKGKPIHGWLNIDKSPGITSTQVVARVKQLLDAAKVGHAGTLDPMATGVLPIALGEATKTVQYVMEGLKSYRFTVRWGEARTTDDRDGEVAATDPARPDRKQIDAVLPGFVGEIQQVPPRFSAVKVDGRRAYDLARADQAVELAPRKVWIERLHSVEWPDRDHTVFEVECGKGAYMRALARDLALALGTVGHLAALRRTAVGPFHAAQAITLDKLDALVHSAGRQVPLLPVETGLEDLPPFPLTGLEASRLRSGQPVSLLRRSQLGRIADLCDGMVLCAMSDGKVVAITRYQAGEIRPLRVLNL